MKAEFQKTVDILVKAYLNDTLIHLDCAACAVGNIIASSLNAEVKDSAYINDEKGNPIKVWQRGETILAPIWQKVFYTPRAQGKQRKWPKKFRGYVKQQIESTGYTWQDLSKIEKAFESVSVPLKDDSLPMMNINVDFDKWMFDGLCAVVDVLAEIHNVDLSVKESAKLQFVRA